MESPPSEIHALECIEFYDVGLIYRPQVPATIAIAGIFYYENWCQEREFIEKNVDLCCEYEFQQTLRVDYDVDDYNIIKEPMKLCPENIIVLFDIML